MSEFINLIGFELEGKFDYTPDGFNFHSDGSVEFEGSNNEDNCDCYEYCECDECFICSICERETSLCECEQCLICQNCENHFDNCDCENEKLDDCKEKDCTDDSLCDNCYSANLDSREYIHDCHLADNVTENCQHECDCQCECNGDENGFTGEMVSIPIRKNQIKEFFEIAIKANYETNSTCGTHEHISFKSNISYMILTDERFYNYYIHEISKWAHERKINPDSQFWKRLEGKNHFCKYGHNPIDQIHMKEHYQGERYHHLNYCYNVDNRKTLEFRLLPAFTKREITLSGLEKQIEIVEKWLIMNPNKWNLNKIELFARIGDDE